MGSAAWRRVGAIGVVMTAGLFRNLGLKVLAVALGLIVWYLVAGEQIVERALRIPLEFVNLPAQLELVGDSPTAVDVRVRGSSGALSRIGGGELVAVLDLQSARPGQRLFHLSGEDVRAPFGIEVVQIAPSTVPMVFEPSMSKIVKIVPGVEGEPRAGFAIGAVSVDPATVEIVGPVSAVMRLTEAITEPVSVANAGAPVTDTVNVGVSDPTVRLRVPTTARVTIAVTTTSVGR
jgi:YbbR domain-containing protein